MSEFFDVDGSKGLFVKKGTSYKPTILGESRFYKILGFLILEISFITCSCYYRKTSTTRNSSKTPTLNILEVKLKIIGRVRPGVINQDVVEDYELKDSGGHRALAIFHQKLNSDPES